MLHHYFTLYSTCSQSAPPVLHILTLHVCFHDRLSHILHKRGGALPHASAITTSTTDNSSGSDGGCFSTTTARVTASVSTRDILASLRV